MSNKFVVLFIILFYRIEIEALCRIYRKLVLNCQITAKALAANSPASVIAKPHATIEVSFPILYFIIENKIEIEKKEHTNKHF